MTDRQAAEARETSQATPEKVREQAFRYKVNFYELPTRDELVAMLEDCARAIQERDEALVRAQKLNKEQP